MVILKLIKKALFKRRLLKLMKYENSLVQESCNKRDWELANKWLHNNKASFKAFRRIEGLS